MIYQVEHEDGVWLVVRRGEIFGRHASEDIAITSAYVLNGWMGTARVLGLGYPIAAAAEHCNSRALG